MYFFCAIVPKKWHIVFGCIAAILLSGCTTQIGTRIDTAIASSKAESLRGWSPTSVDGKRLPTMLFGSIPILLRNPRSVSVVFDDHGPVVDWTLGPEGGTGAAVPIAEDGYYLTAGHMVKGASSIALVGHFRRQGESRQFEKVPARVVWQPDFDLSPGNPSLYADIGIVHAEVDALSVFAIAKKPPASGEPILIAGWPTGYFDTFLEGASIAAGQTLLVTKKEGVGAAASFVAIRHDAPTVAGDSGGPLLDREGKLIGINSAVGWSTSPWHGLAILLGTPPRLDQIAISNLAIMPNLSWLRQVIESDRRRADQYSD